MATKKSSYEQYEAYVEEIANGFYEAIKTNNIPWQKPWTTEQMRGSSAFNPITKTVYQGMNTISLDIKKMKNDYSSNAWLTFNQAKELGGNIKKGEKSARISFFKINKYSEIVKDKNGDDKEDEKTKVIFKQSYVFNLDQIENLTPEKVQELKNTFKTEILPTKEKDFIDIEQVEDILKNSQIQIYKHGTSAYYSPSTDAIMLPPKESFRDEVAYYSTALHELGHATGHESRLNRVLISNRLSPNYAKEELRAELYSYLQAKELGIGLDLQNHQSYIQSWTRGLENQKDEIISAVKDALKIVQYVKENYIQKSLLKDLAQEKDYLEKRKYIGADLRSAFTFENYQKIEKLIDKSVDYLALNNSKDKFIFQDKNHETFTYAYLKDEKLNIQSVDLSTAVSIFKANNLSISNSFNISANHQNRQNSISR